MDDLALQLRDLLGRPPRLLLADSQPQGLQVLQQSFTADCQLFSASSAAQTMSLARTLLPDLMLLEDQLPGEEGVELLQTLQSEPDLAAIPVILLTPAGDAAAQARALAGGATDTVDRPCQPAVLRARVKTHLTLRLQSELLRELVFVDSLTGLHNRRYFNERFESELQRARRNGTPLGLLLADVDYFQPFNEHYGPQAGDDALRGVAVALRSALKRPGDLVCRFDGEAFAVLLPETELEGAHSVAAQLQASVQALGTPHDRSGLPERRLSISQGGVICVPGARHDCVKLLAAANAQLFQAKAQGRARALLAAA